MDAKLAARSRVPVNFFNEFGHFPIHHSDMWQRQDGTSLVFADLD
jgi:hypothetical protein